MTSKNLKQKKLYGLVLTGGKSTRMRQDKAALEYHGKPQSIYTFELLGSICEKVFFSNRKEQSHAAGQEGYPQIHDQEPFLNSGPMGGILSAMTAYPESPWIVLACDLPRITETTLEYLTSKRNAAKIATAFRSAHDQMPEPLCAIYEPQAFPELRIFFEHGKTCPRKFLMNADIELLELPNKFALDNVNTPEEYQAAVNKIQVSSPMKTIKIHYYAILREQRGASSESLQTSAETVFPLYEELKGKYNFTLSTNVLKVAVNNEFCSWGQPIRSGDVVVFIPPVAGG